LAAGDAAPGSRRSPFLYVLLAVAVLVGVVAVLLAGTAPTAPSSRAGQIVIDLPTGVWGLLFLGPLLVGLGAAVLQRLRNGAVGIPSRMLLTFVVMIVLCFLFLYLLAGAGTGGTGTVSLGGASPPASTNQSAPPNVSGPPPNGTSVAAPQTVTITLTDVVAVVAALSVCVAVLAIPGVLSRVVDRSRAGRRPPSVRPEVERALADAGAALDRGEDLRETVVRLYVQLLFALGPRAGDVAVLTADEIRRDVLTTLGVSAPAAEALTRVFEEARYSTHPIGPADAGRFREAIRRAEADLSRGGAS
jgi:hypothetical protein